jgi:anthranilate synthase component 1
MAKALTEPGPLQISVDYRFDPLRLHARAPQRYPFLLESTAQGTAQGRYDLLMGFPGQVLDSRGSKDGVFLERLDRAWHAAALNDDGPAAPFAGGWFLLLGYELAAQIETSLDLPTDSELPVALAVRVRAALVRDHARREAWLVAEPGAAALLEDMQRDLRSAAATPADDVRAPLAAVIEEESPARFLAAVEKAKGYIAAGDIFQANLSRQWRASLQAGCHPHELYARLRRSNPGPFAGLASFDDFAVVSSSPERLVQVREGRVSTRPIAGTRPRRNRDQDEPMRSELLGDPKDRAEHIMLIDLERNDLGRICRSGSVEVDEFMAVESYSHVHHIVSNVSGRLRDEVTPGQVIRATFPGGTITGCPKVRCMELIAELEGRPRGFYTGAMGYLGHNGNLDLNILIRSIEMRGEHAMLAAGSGIVADSDPQLELEETRAKAKGMLLALSGTTGPARD